MYGKHTSANYTSILQGIQIKTLCYGEATLMSEFLLQKDAILPEHSHPYEQTGYLVKGKLRLHIGGNSKELIPGDSWNIARDIPHKAEVLEDSVAIEVFCPLREDYLQFVSNSEIEK